MRKKNTVYLVLGLPGAGKSSFVDFAFGNRPIVDGDYVLDGCVRSDTRRICFDSIRRAMGHEFLQETEPMVNAIAYIMAYAALIEKRDVLVDESITLPHIALEFANIARKYGANLHIFHLVTPLEECRDARVPFGFPEEDFNRKVSEWRVCGAHILSLADTVETVAQHWETTFDEPAFVLTRDTYRDVLDGLKSVPLQKLDGFYTFNGPIPVSQFGDYRNKALNELLRFIAEVCAIGPEVSVLCKDLYEAYRDWCIQGDRPLLPPRQFSKQCQELGLRQVKANASYWRGICLADRIGRVSLSEACHDK